MAFPDSWNAIHRLVIMVEKLEKINTPLQLWGWKTKSAAEEEAQAAEEEDVLNAKQYVEDFLSERLKTVGTKISIRGFNATITIKNLDVKITITYRRDSPEIDESAFDYKLIYPDLVMDAMHANKKWTGKGLESCIKILKQLREWQKY